jgi:hypothetical protein
LEDPKDGKMGTRGSSEMSVICYQTAWCHIPEEGTLLTVVVIIHCEENKLCVGGGGRQIKLLQMSVLCLHNKHPERLPMGPLEEVLCAIEDSSLLGCDAVMLFLDC